MQSTTKINRENNQFVTSIYRKPKLSGFFTNFDSFTSKCNKRSLIGTLLYRVYTGKSSLDLRARLKRTIEKNVPFSKLNVVFRSTWLLITEICSDIFS